jgi:hypothetical protein
MSLGGFRIAKYLDDAPFVIASIALKQTPRLKSIMFKWGGGLIGVQGLTFQQSSTDAGLK